MKLIKPSVEPTMKIQLSAFSTKGPKKVNQDKYCIININYEIN